MARRRYLVAYDIADPRRLRHICKIMESYGQRLQYSVFICDLSVGEVSGLEREVMEVMRIEEDSVVRIDLGAPDSGAAITFIGRRRPLLGSEPLIV